MLQFEPTAAYVAKVFAQQAYDAASIDRRATFLDFLFVDQNFSCEDHRLCPLTGCRQPTFHKQFVETCFQWLRVTFMGIVHHESVSTRCGAECWTNLLRVGYGSKFLVILRVFNFCVE